VLPLAWTEKNISCMNTLSNRLQLVASTYGSSTYDRATYGQQATTGTGSGSALPPGNGPLTDTGIAAAAIVTVAALVLLTATIVRIWRRSDMASLDDH
jgi:hypothetical protein